MDLIEQAHKDPNTLPCFITSGQTGRIVPVHFESLTAADESELGTKAWREALFAQSWIDLTKREMGFKLVCSKGRVKRILGVVSPGRVEWIGGSLRRSLLETMPHNQYGRLQRRYRGIGCVLVARLVAESYRQLGLGKVIVAPSPGKESFYLTLGFKDLPGTGKMLLDEREAANLLLTVCIGDQGISRV